MIKYAKIIDNETKQCDVGLGTNIEFYKKIGFTELDVEQAYNGGWYLKGYAPTKPEPTIQEQIETLEKSITSRNIRSAIQGDTYALNKLQQVEEQIEELRKKLGNN